MSHIFPVFDLGRSTAGALPLPNATPVYEYLPQPEPGAAHFLLGGTPDSLRAFGGSATLTAQGDKHTFGSNYARTPDYGQALVTNLADMAVQTHIAVLQFSPNAGKNTLILGNVDTGTQGWGLWIAESGQVASLMRGNNPAFLNLGVPEGVAVGDYIFVAHQLWEQDGVTRFRSFIGSKAFEGQWTAKRAIAPRPAALGNAYQNAPSGIYAGAPVNYAEYIAFPGVVKTPQEIAAIYARSKRRMRARGITLK